MCRSLVTLAAVIGALAVAFILSGGKL